ncbi:hypothetical protein P7C70_g4566, partial [Phenoliferia sp. Uapishka_3]
MSAPYHGSCYCGDIEIELADEIDGGILCHCRTCQKLHTHNSYNVQSTQDKLKVVKGKTAIYKDDKTDSGSAIYRHFCGNCGSALFSFPDLFPGAAFVKIGALDRAAEIKPKAEIYVDTAMGHSVLKKDAGTKQFEGFMAKEV